MRHRVLPPSFFQRPTDQVARELLGKYLVRRYRGRELAVSITEVEIYDGFSDRASHASRGKTVRTAPMFGEAGHWFVYFTYGFHWMLNVVTREEGYPAAILIRGVEGTNGPGRLTAKFRVDKSFNTLRIAKQSALWIENRGIHVPHRSIKKGPRIGVAYAGRYWGRRRLRFWIEASP